MPSLNDAATRYSPLNQINASNAGHLQVAWTFSTGVLRGHEGQPLVIGNVMYLVTPFPNTVYALDLNHEGRILWQYEPTQNAEVIPVMCCDTVNRGVAYGDGKIILHQADNTLVALDAQDRQGGLARLASYKEGRDRDRRTAGGRQTRSSSASRAASSACRASSPRWTSRTGIPSGTPIRKGRTTRSCSIRIRRFAGQAGRRGFQSEDLEGRPVEDRWRRYLGLVFV